MWHLVYDTYNGVLTTNCGEHIDTTESDFIEYSDMIRSDLACNICILESGDISGSGNTRLRQA